MKKPLSLSASVLCVLRVLCGGSAVAVLLFGLWLLGQIARDVTWASGIVFYIPSLPVAIVFVLLAALLLHRSRHTAMATALLAIPPLVVVFAVENHWTRPVVRHGHGLSYTLVHWNVYHGKWGWGRVRAQVAEHKPDICVISEPLVKEVTLENAVHWFGPNRAIAWMGDMVVIAQGPITVGDNLLAGRARANLVTWRPADALNEVKPVSILVVDLPADVFTARDPLLRQIHCFVERLRPDLIVGDFNAPRRSWMLARLPKGYAHAYDLAGCGWSYTWPFPCPLLAIDQCIVGPRIEAERYDLYSGVSDHRLQRLRFRLLGTAHGGVSVR